MTIPDDGAAVYYPCSSCKRSKRDSETTLIPEYGMQVCNDCKKDLEMLERIAKGLRNLPDIPGQRPGEQSGTKLHQ